MAEINNVPAIRFKGFGHEWIDKPFHKTFSSVANNTLSRAELNYSSGTVKNVHYGDVLIKFGELLDAEKDEIPFISNEALASKYKTSKLQYGDVVIADAAEDETVGKCTEITNIGNQIIVSGLHTIPVRPELKFGSKYLGYYMNSNAFHNQLLRLMQGTKVLSISKTAIKDTSVVFPSETDEQTQIGSYFQRLDKLISLHQTKVNKLTTLKNAMLEKMFPKQGEDVPEIRFKSFAGAWEEMKLSDMSDYKNGKGHENKQLPTGKYELINLNSISIDGGLKHSGKYINETDSTLNKNDLVMVLSDVGHGDLLGRVALIPENNKYVLNQRVALLRPKQNVNPTFMFYDINAHQIYFKSQGAGMSQLNLSKSSVENFASKVPKISEEQEKIGDFFQNLDNLIFMNKSELEKLTNLKKACLEKMFV